MRAVENVYLQHSAQGYDVQVITPLNSLREKLNSALQATCNRSGMGVTGSRRLRDGDPVIYRWKGASVAVPDESEESVSAAKVEIGDRIANGETGTLLRDEEGFVLRTPVRERRRLTTSQMKAMELAYAVTIHASQGSEWSHVVVAVPPSRSGFITREMLYTAATRAKVSLTLVGCRETMKRACRRVALNSRVTLPGPCELRSERNSAIEKMNVLMVSVDF